MDVDISNEHFDANITLQQLKEAFPEKTLDPSKRIVFSLWKLSELKCFLRVAKSFKGLSKAKKETVLIAVVELWDKITSEMMFSANDIADSDIVSLSSPQFSSLPCSPTSSGFFSAPTSPTSQIQVPTPSAIRYPATVDGMNMDDFKKWTIPQLSEYLSDRCINKSGNKTKLVENVYGAYMQKLPVTFTDPQQEKRQIDHDVKSKLILEDGMVILPHPSSLTGEWIVAPSSLPDTTHDNVKTYLINNNAGKAFQGGKSLLESGHVNRVMVHMTSPNLRYCFVRGLCHPEQKLSKPPYDVWVLLQKDSGEIVNGECGCVAGVSGWCKHVGALLWYIEKEVRLGNNKTCTSKKQQWSVPSKRQQSLHQPDTVLNITMSKPKPQRVLSPSPVKKKPRLGDPRHEVHRVSRPLKEIEIDTLADITNGRCGIVVLMRKAHNADVDVVPEAACFEEVETTKLNFPKQIETIISEMGPEKSYQEFANHLTISFEQQDTVQEATKEQSKSELWFSYRKNRITASNFKNAVHKIDCNGDVINPDKCKTIIANICGFKKYFETKATKWGIDNEPIARNLYVKRNKSKHKKLQVTEPGFFIDLNYSFIGASPDGLIHCDCHGDGVLEIKCPWATRDLKIKEYAVTKGSCLEEKDNEIHLKRSHIYFYQVQCQMMCSGRLWCDFFLCTSKDSFQERIHYDGSFMADCVAKAATCYEKIIFPELLQHFRDMEIEGCVREVVSDLLDMCELDFDIEVEMEMKI